LVLAIVAEHQRRRSRSLLVDAIADDDELATFDHFV